jgi:hypothetical protein
MGEGRATHAAAATPSSPSAAPSTSSGIHVGAAAHQHAVEPPTQHHARHIVIAPRQLLGRVARVHEAVRRGAQPQQPRALEPARRHVGRAHVQRAIHHALDPAQRHAPA